MKTKMAIVMIFGLVIPSLSTKSTLNWKKTRAKLFIPDHFNASVSMRRRTKYLLITFIH